LQISHRREFLSLQIPILANSAPPQYIRDRRRTDDGQTDDNRTVNSTVT